MGETRSAVARIAVDDELGSAQQLIERFCQDVRLWVVEEVPTQG